jgi:hypothetical protein
VIGAAGAAGSAAAAAALAWAGACGAGWLITASACEQADKAAARPSTQTISKRLPERRLDISHPPKQLVGNVALLLKKMTPDRMAKLFLLRPILPRGR